MRELCHPLTRALYGIDPDTGLIRVQEQGKVGHFTCTGVWQSGDVFEVDPLMCHWVGGPQVDAGYDKPFKTV